MFKFRKNKIGAQASGNLYTNGSGCLVKLQDIVKTYKTGNVMFTALNGVNLRIDRGEFVAILGKSGSGKSTLANLITGIDRPTSGEVLVGGAAVHEMNESQMALWRGRNVGVIFQFFQLMPTLSAVENVILPMDFCGVYPGKARRERALHLLDRVEMADMADKLPSTLSGGQQQRVAIARALANDPPIVVADEPTGNLDSRTAAAVFRLFKEMVAEGKTILMVTHDRELAGRVGRIITISDGVISGDTVPQRPSTAAAEVAHV